MIHKDYLLENKFTPRNITNDNKNDTEQVSMVDIYEYVKSLKESVKTWYQILNPLDSKFSPEEKTWLSKIGRLSRLERSTTILLIMVFFIIEKSSASRVRFLKTIERWLFVYRLAGRMEFVIEPKLVNFIEIAIELNKGNISSDKVIKDLEKMSDDIVNTPQYIESMINNFNKSGFYAWKDIKYFLFEYEIYLKAKSKTHRNKIDSLIYFSEDDKDHYTVEHIYPQRPRKSCWVEKFSKYTDRERIILRNSLGNLLPLSQPKNSSFQNKCFEDKKGNNIDKIGFLYGSYSENEVAQNEEWSAEKILERGLMLLDFMEFNWKISFSNRKNKIRALGLEFLNKRKA